MIKLLLLGLTFQEYDRVVKAGEKTESHKEKHLTFCPSKKWLSH